MVYIDGGERKKRIKNGNSDLAQTPGKKPLIEKTVVKLGLEKEK